MVGDMCTKHRWFALLPTVKRRHWWAVTVHQTLRLLDLDFPSQVASLSCCTFTSRTQNTVVLDWNFPALLLVLIQISAMMKHWHSDRGRRQIFTTEEEESFLKTSQKHNYYVITSTVLFYPQVLVYLLESGKKCVRWSKIATHFQMPTLCRW